MSEVNAWLLDLGSGLYAAVGEPEIIHVLPDVPTLFAVPQAPAHCRQVLVWQGAIVPLMDIATRLVGRPNGVTAAGGRIVIAAFQERPGAPARQGALLLNAAPVRIRVNDDQACELPQAPPAWRRLAAACFEHSQRGPVPVLDLPAVFSVPKGAYE